MAFEARLFRSLARYGIRGGSGDPPPRPLRGASAPSSAGSACSAGAWCWGAGAEDVLGGLPDEDWAAREEALGYLYDREYAPGRNVRRQGSRTGQRGQGGLEPSRLTVPEWINAVHQLFPRRTIERIEKDALERYGLEEMVTNPDLLRRARPSPTLLKAVLRTKHLMNAEVLDLARSLVRQTIQELMERLARPVQAPFLGAVNRRTRSPLRVARTSTPGRRCAATCTTTTRQSGRLVLERPYFSSRVRRHADRWQPDHPGRRVREHAGQRDPRRGHGRHLLRAEGHQDPPLPLRHLRGGRHRRTAPTRCETLMKVQLGGGTDIGQAVTYAASLVDDPRRTIVVLISDFFEGAPQARLLSAVKALVESGVTLLGLAALDESARPRLRP